MSKSLASLRQCFYFDSLDRNPFYSALKSPNISEDRKRIPRISSLSTTYFEHEQEWKLLIENTNSGNWSVN
jgi:hypothetical protein